MDFEWLNSHLIISGKYFTNEYFNVGDQIVFQCIIDKYGSMIVDTNFVLLIWLLN